MLPCSDYFLFAPQGELLLWLQILLIYFPCFWIAKTHHNSTKNEKYTTLTKLKMCKHKYENKILLVKFWWRGTSLCVWEAQIMWWRKILANFHFSSPPSPCPARQQKMNLYLYLLLPKQYFNTALTWRRSKKIHKCLCEKNKDFSIFAY